MHIIDIKKSRSCNFLCVPNKVNEEGEENHAAHARPTSAMGNECQVTEHVESKTSILDESNVFMIKTTVLLTLICLPGNIVAAAIFYKHTQNYPKTVEQSDINVNYPPIVQQIIPQTVSYNRNIFCYQKRSYDHESPCPQ